MAAIAIVPMLFALAAGQDSNLVFVLALASGLLIRAVVQPLAVLIHELGHAITAVLLSGQRITLQIGQPDDRGTVSIAKIDLLLGLGTHPAHIRVLPAVWAERDWCASSSPGLSPRCSSRSGSCSSP